MPKTDDDILRELLHRATDDLHAPPAVATGIVTRHHRRLRNTRLLSLSTTTVAAAAVVATAVVARLGPAVPEHASHPAALPTTGLPATGVPATELPAVKLTAMQVLDQLSVAAGRAPAPAGRYITLTEDRGEGIQVTNVFDSLTGNVLTFQFGPGVPHTFPIGRHWSPTRAQFAAWPTNPAKLRALLLSPADQATGEGAVSAGLPYEPNTDDTVFSEVTDWLWNPLLPPALRAAMYKVLAATPGVTVKTGTQDMAGRPAIEISRYASSDQVATFEDPSTGAVLEQNFGLAGSSVYISVVGSATLPADPYLYLGG